MSIRKTHTQIQYIILHKLYRTSFYEIICNSYVITYVITYNHMKYITLI